MLKTFTITGSHFSFSHFSNSLFYCQILIRSWGGKTTNISNLCSTLLMDNFSASLKSCHLFWGSSGFENISFSASDLQWKSVSLLKLGIEGTPQ